MPASPKRRVGVGRPVHFYRSISFGFGAFQLATAAVSAAAQLPPAWVGAISVTGVATIGVHFFWPNIVVVVKGDPEHRDAHQLLIATDKLDDVCRTFEVCLADNDLDKTPTGGEVAAYFFENWGRTLCPLWRDFADKKHITVCIRTIHGRDKSKMITTKVFPISVAREKVQPETLDVADTICGRAYREQDVVIVPRLEDDPDYRSIERMWPGILEHVQSVIAAPVWVRKPAGKRNTSNRDYVAAVLQIDSPDADTFQDTKACRALATLCANKLGLIVQLGLFVDQHFHADDETEAEADAADATDSTPELEESDAEGPIVKRIENSQDGAFPE